MRARQANVVHDSTSVIVGLLDQAGILTQSWRMKNVLKSLLLIFLAYTAGLPTAYGAVVKLASGSLDFLKQEKQINLEYVYDGMTVRADKQEVPEKDYVMTKTTQLDAKVAGHGQLWREGWIDDRAAIYQAKFQDVLNKIVTAKKLDLQFGSFKDSKYTLILKTTCTELGWKFSDVIKHPFLINAQADFVETQNPTNLLADLTIIKAPGSADGTDFATRRGLGEAYGNAGKELGILLAKKLK